MRARLVIGADEVVRILPENLVVAARVDTGAETSSLHAVDIEHFERHGNSWVRFRTLDENTGMDAVLERPRVRWSRIRNRAAEARRGKGHERRPVVELQVRLQHRERTIEVNLTDRQPFEYKMLVGRSGILEFDAIVDPAAPGANGKARPAKPH